MTDTPMNGVDPAAAGKAQRNAEDLHMQSFIGPVMIGAVNGCMRSLPSFGVERVVLMLAGCFGKCLGEVLSIGELVPVMKLRQRCLEVIEREMKRTEIRPMPQNQPGTFGAVPPETKELLKKIKPQ